MIHLDTMRVRCTPARAHMALILWGAWLTAPGPVIAGHGHARGLENDAVTRASQTVLRLARSADGLRFTDTHEVFLQGASAPDLLALPDGRLIAVFDLAVDDAPDAETVPAVSLSRDGGRRWSPARPLRFKGVRSSTFHPRHGDLIRTPGGRLRLYFVTDAAGRDSHERNSIQGGVVIRSAISRSGRDYRLDGATRVHLANYADVYPAVGSLHKRFHLFAGGARTADHDGSVGRVAHYISSDGRRFARLGATNLKEQDFVGSLVNWKNGLRAYDSSPAGVISLTSPDGRLWRKESGLRLAGGRDPAVTRLLDGSYLMLYVAPVDDTSTASSTLVQAPLRGAAGDEAEAWNGADGPDPVNGRREGASTTEGEVADTAEESQVEGADVVVAANGETLWQDDRSLVGDDPTGTDTPDGEPAPAVDAAGRTGLEDYDPVAANGFAPWPDFKHPIDYVEWYKRYALRQTDDNAYDAYISFMPGYDGLTPDGVKWPELINLFKDDSYEGPPAPWEPAEHPAWEASNRTALPLIEKFREATMHTDYASPPDLYNGEDIVDPAERKLLIGMLLPSLSPHRDMVKATLADAWRKGEDGRVSSDRMLEAWRTSLRGAAHLAQGGTLIEELVALAERAQVQKTARWALKDGVFSDDELEAALDTLRRLDRDERDPMESIRGEHGFAMDITQYLFSPPGPDGRPKVNPDRAEKVIDWTSADALSVEDFARMTAEDADATIEAFDRHYRELAEMMRIGYPDVRAADIQALEQRTLNTSPLTRVFLPSLSRIYTLKTRAETSRRATQLAYETSLFKARNGRWPDSLDELPVSDDDRSRIDPFSGQYFRYRLTDDGPQIYSVSENGLDDDGVHSRRWEDSADETGGSDDFVFWPPQPRSR